MTLYDVECRMQFVRQARLSFDISQPEGLVWLVEERGGQGPDYR